MKTLKVLSTWSILMFACLPEFVLGQGIALTKLQNIIPPTQKATNVSIPVSTMHPEFYPLGFSKKGLFAYIEIPPDEAIGCYLWKFSIISLVTDKVLVDEYFNDDTQDDCDRVVDLPSLLKYHGESFDKQLAKYAINTKSLPAFRQFPFGWEGNEYRAELEQVNKQTIGETNSIKFEVKLFRNKKSKVIGRIQEEDIEFRWGPEIFGLIKSPYEARTLVLVTETLRGYEGPPDVLTLHLFGASLVTGF